MEQVIKEGRVGTLIDFGPTFFSDGVIRSPIGKHTGTIYPVSNHVPVFQDFVIVLDEEFLQMILRVYREVPLKNIVAPAME